MPIRPENRDRYLKPKAWKALRVTILARAGNVCEWEGCGAVNGQPHLRTPLIFYSRAKSVSNTGRVPMSSVYFAINGASRWAGMLGIRS